MSWRGVGGYVLPISSVWSDGVTVDQAAALVTAVVAGGVALGGLIRWLVVGRRHDAASVDEARARLDALRARSRDLLNEAERQAAEQSEQAEREVQLRLMRSLRAVVEVCDMQQEELDDLVAGHRRMRDRLRTLQESMDACEERCREAYARAGRTVEHLKDQLGDSSTVAAEVGAILFGDRDGDARGGGL